jgi:protein O-mannosyl-transferase
MSRNKNSSGSNRASTPKSLGFWTQNWLPALVLLVLPLILYVGALRLGYVLDDKLVLSENQFVQKGSRGIRDIFTHDSFTGYLGTQQNLVAGARYRPLSLATFAIEHQLFGVSPGMSHFMNVFLYGLTALLIFKLLSGLVPDRPERAWYLRLPFVTALLFALHPLHTEAVANIKGRDEILALLLALAAASYCLRGIVEGKTSRTWVAAALFLLAIFAKENAIMFLFVIPLMLLAFTESGFKKVAMQMVPFVAATGLYLIIRYSVIGFLLGGDQEITNLMNNPFLQATGSQRSATVSLTMAWYLKLLVVPHPLTHDYYPYHVPLVSWADWRAIVGLVTNVGLIALAVLAWKKAKLVSFAIGYYLLTLSVVANIFFQVGTFMNERFLYMPSLAFCMVLAWLLCEKLPQWFTPKPQLARTVALTVLGVLGAGYALRTFTRVPDWASTYTLNAASVKVSSESAYSNAYYAFALYEKSDQAVDPLRRKELLDEALPYANKALEIYPEYPDALNAKSCIMVGYFQLNNQIAPLLAWLEKVQKTYPIKYVDTVIRDLIAFGQHRVELNYWLQEVGYNHFWVAKGDKEKANEYIQLLKSIDPVNPNVDIAISNIAKGIR